MKIYRAEFCYRSTEEYCLNGILGYFSTPEKAYEAVNHFIENEKNEYEYEYCETYADNGMKYYEGSYGDIFVSEIELDKEIWND